MERKEPALVMEYNDQIENFKGWLVIDGTEHQLCAGGMRVQKGLTVEHLKEMARNMSRKMKIIGIPVDGAKCGIDYDPVLPGKKEAISRFIQAISPIIKTRYSMGPDLNTKMDELDEIARCYDMPSIKMAVAKVQGYTNEYFSERCEVLKKEALHGWTLGAIRSGYGVAMATMPIIEYLKIHRNVVRITVQGFGSLAQASILALLDEGVRVKAISDMKKSVIARPNKFLPVEKWLDKNSTLMPEIEPTDDYFIGHRDDIYKHEMDIFMPQAIENAVNIENVNMLNTKAIVPGANLAVQNEVKDILHKRGVMVLPCFVVGCGGSMSMNGLFGHKEHPTTRQVMEYMRKAMGKIVCNIIESSIKENITPTDAAEKIIGEERIWDRTRPYEV